jgi:hypothetical protein
MTTVMIQNTAGKGMEIQSTTEEQQHRVERTVTQET